MGIWRHTFFGERRLVKQQLGSLLLKLRRHGQVRHRLGLDRSAVLVVPCREMLQPHPFAERNGFDLIILAHFRDRGCKDAQCCREPKEVKTYMYKKEGRYLSSACVRAVLPGAQGGGIAEKKRIARSRAQAVAIKIGCWGAGGAELAAAVRAAAEVVGQGGSPPAMESPGSAPTDCLVRFVAPLTVITSPAGTAAFLPARTFWAFLDLPAGAGSAILPLELLEFLCSAMAATTLSWACVIFAGFSLIFFLPLGGLSAEADEASPRSAYSPPNILDSCDRGAVRRVCRGQWTSSGSRRSGVSVEERGVSVEERGTTRHGSRRSGVSVEERGVSVEERGKTRPLP